MLTGRQWLVLVENFVAVVKHFYFPLLHRSSILDQVVDHKALT